MADADRRALHRTMVVVDVEKFGSPDRTLPNQMAIRERLNQVVFEALAEAGVPSDVSYHEDRGDGVFVLVPPETPKASLVETLPAALAAALRRHNTTSDDTAPVRLRLALHTGEVAFDEHGATSAAVTTAFRLLDAAALKQALHDSAAPVAVIVSRQLFDEVVLHSRTLDPATFRQVDITVKDTRDSAWIALPDSLIRHLKDADHSAGIHQVTVYTSGDDGTSVRDALVELLETAGGTITASGEPERGSWFQQLFARQNDPDAVKNLAEAVTAAVANELASDTIETVVQGRDITIEVHAPDTTSEERTAHAIARLLDACRGHEDVVVYTRHFLLIKIGPQITAWEPTDDECHFLDCNPALLHSPHELVAAMAAVAHRPHAGRRAR
ncbi:hypothetical protein FHS29_005071 [Saccharothrix tamanrassetensis]|uniref:Uncharacterized protein n=1 Tax=Saccharothrix tamanrassetensis TaxID=1051531 RepID=A0A841CNH5_9PSEU|nr:hypothetical protein [Saccharothrix tamanrassetensis]MBB5958463.1 hypothetical protein [Saccharothrix tamanrassetensis]